jgi:hypothetical protein
MKLRDMWAEANPVARIGGVVIVTGIALATAYGLVGHDVTDMFVVIWTEIKSWL